MTGINSQLTKLMHYKQKNKIEGEKKSLFVFLFMFFVDVIACAASFSFSKLCSSHFVNSRSVLPEMSW